MVGQDIGDASRYGHHRLRSDGRPAGQLTATGGSYTGPARRSRSHPTRPEPLKPTRAAEHASSGWGEAPLAHTWGKFPFGEHSSTREIAIITPNYDDFIKRDIDGIGVELASKADWSPLLASEIIFPTDTDPLSAGLTPTARAWMTGSPPPNADRLSIIHLHGRIPYESDDTDRMYPVIGEGDYSMTEDWSRRALQSVFAQSSVLMVGTSLADAPLLRALMETKDSAIQYPRYALIRLDSALSASSNSRRFARARFDHLGVIPIFHDYFVQASQFIQELSTCLKAGSKDAYVRHGSDVRYGSRLGTWWAEWDKKNVDLSKHQRECHRLLRDCADDARKRLKSSSSESLKIEAWVRWKPMEQRALRLWASSSGTWPDSVSMREADIADDDQTMAVLAFRAGRPILYPGDRETMHVTYTRRWQTYIAAPVWNLENPAGTIPVGVISIASTKPYEESSLNVESNRSRVVEVLTMLAQAGGGLFAPGNDSIARSREDLNL